MSKHNEDTRVKIPALVHFTRLGYEYISAKTLTDTIKDVDTNIVIPTLCDAINRINNTEISILEVKKIVDDIKVKLDSDDLGREFYNIITKGYNGLKLIDLESQNGILNTYEVVTELTCKNGNDEFRPDITVLINGIPLSFIEVNALII